MQTLSSAKTSGVVLPDAQIINTNPNFSLYLTFHSANSCSRWGKWTESTGLHVTDATNTVGNFSTWAVESVAVRSAADCSSLHHLKSRTNKSSQHRDRSLAQMGSSRLPDLTDQTEQMIHFNSCFNSLSYAILSLSWCFHEVVVLVCYICNYRPNWQISHKNWQAATARAGNWKL